MKSVVQKGMGDNARLVMVMHPVAEGRFTTAVARDLEARPAALAAAVDPGDRGGVRRVKRDRQCASGRVPLIERYRDRLPLAADAPVVTLHRGLDAARATRRGCRERLGIETHLKFEGMNPTGSFKDRGMTVAVSQAKANGAEAIICASTGNTAASAAAYAARAGLRGAVIVPEGKIAQGKLAQAVIHGARVIALRGNFDQALELVKQIVERQPVELVNSINPYRIEGQKTAAFEVCDELGAAPDALAIPVGNAGNITAWWKGFCEYGQGRPRLYGFQAEGAAPIVLGKPVEQPGDGRLGDPDRQPGALAGGAGGARGVGRPRRGRQRRRDPRGAALARLERGRLLRAGLGRLRGRRR